MSSRTHERRTEHPTAEEVAEVEHQLWEFAKRIDPPSVPEAKLRPGAFLWRLHRTWHSLGRGTGGLASRSFRALRDELLKRDPPVRNLQPKLYGNTPLAHAEAEQLIDLMLETWHLERDRNGRWQAKALFYPEDSKTAGSHDLEAIRENLLHTLFKGEDSLLLEEPVGAPPEVFFEDRGRSSLALILPTKSEIIAHLSPSNAYGGFSAGLEKFFDAAIVRLERGERAPILVWVLRIRAVRDNAEFHQSFHAISMHSACLTNWYFRLSHRRKSVREQAETFWRLIIRHSAFVIHGLPDWNRSDNQKEDFSNVDLDEDLAELDPGFLMPSALPIVLGNHRLVRRHQDHSFGLTVSIEASSSNEEGTKTNPVYWLFPDHPKGDLTETAETTGLPVFNADQSPGPDFDLAYQAIYNAVCLKLGFTKETEAQRSLATLTAMGWKVLNVTELQKLLTVATELPELD